MRIIEAYCFSEIIALSDIALYNTEVLENQPDPT